MHLFLLWKNYFNNYFFPASFSLYLLLTLYNKENILKLLSISFRIKFIFLRMTDSLIFNLFMKHLSICYLAGSISQFFVYNRIERKKETQKNNFLNATTRCIVYSPLPVCMSLCSLYPENNPLYPYNNDASYVILISLAPLLTYRK